MEIFQQEIPPDSFAPPKPPISILPPPPPESSNSEPSEQLLDFCVDDLPDFDQVMSSPSNSPPKPDIVEQKEEQQKPPEDKKRPVEVKKQADLHPPLELLPPLIMEEAFEEKKFGEISVKEKLSVRDRNVKATIIWTFERIDQLKVEGISFETPFEEIPKIYIRVLTNGLNVKVKDEDKEAFVVSGKLDPNQEPGDYSFEYLAVQ